MHTHITCTHKAFVKMIHFTVLLIETIAEWTHWENLTEGVCKKHFFTPSFIPFSHFMVKRGFLKPSFHIRKTFVTCFVKITHSHSFWRKACSPFFSPLSLKTDWFAWRQNCSQIPSFSSPHPLSLALISNCFSVWMFTHRETQKQNKREQRMCVKDRGRWCLLKLLFAPEPSCWQIMYNVYLKITALRWQRDRGGLCTIQRSK